MDEDEGVNGAGAGSDYPERARAEGDERSTFRRDDSPAPEVGAAPAPTGAPAITIWWPAPLRVQATCPRCRDWFEGWGVSTPDGVLCLTCAHAVPMLGDWSTLCGLVASIDDFLTRVAPAEREMFADHLAACATGIAKQFPEGR